MGVPDPEEGGDLGVEPPAETCNCKLQPNRQSYAATWRIQTRSWVDLPQRFRFLPNYFGLCSIHLLTYFLACLHNGVT